jgi:flavin reductase (DIM6/NTAB) family NADH-FMN oxidoreductase RutF
VSYGVYFLQVGGSFVLNCLGEDDADATMKHFLKRFGAGADRFQVGRTNDIQQSIGAFESSFGVWGFVGYWGFKSRMLSCVTVGCPH